MVTWLGNQLKSLSVRIEYNKEVPESEDVLRFLLEEEEKPDTIVVATGSTPIKSGVQMISFHEVPGWKEANVRSVDEVMTRKFEMRGKRILVADSTPISTAPVLVRCLQDMVLQKSLSLRHKLKSRQK